jgi:hypothetical protein
LLEVFPEYIDELNRQLLPKGKFIRKTFKKLLAAKWSADPQKSFDLVYFIGLNAGAYLALNKPVPPAIARVIKHLKVGEIL